MAVVSSDIPSFLISKKPEYWKPVGKDIVPESKYCPEAVTQYAAKPQKFLATDVRTHLSYLGWKIEFSREGGILRFRYTSPHDARRSYLSLHKVCLDLRAATYNEEIVEVQEIERILDIVTQVQEPNKTEMLDVQQVLHNSPGNGSKLMETSNNNVVVEPEYCPQAVLDWYLYDSKNKDKRNIGVKPAEMKLKAKKHLSYMGWVFWFGVKRDKRELRYTSPGGTCYYSLRTACKGCMDEEGGGRREREIVALNGNLSTGPFDVGATESSGVMQLNKRKRKDDLSTPELQQCETEDNGCQMKVESAIGLEAEDFEVRK